VVTVQDDSPRIDPAIWWRPGLAAVLSAVVVGLWIFAPAAVLWIGVAISLVAVGIPFLLGADPEDHYEDGFEWGWLFALPLLAVGILVVGLGVLVRAIA
jgi:hypothetical protein